MSELVDLIEKKLGGSRSHIYRNVAEALDVLCISCDIATASAAKTAERLRDKMANTWWMTRNGEAVNSCRRAAPASWANEFLSSGEDCNGNNL